MSSMRSASSSTQIRTRSRRSNPRHQIEQTPRGGIYVDHYNTVRLHSAIGFITPADMLAGRQTEIHAARDRKLEEARQQRQKRRQQAA